MTQISFYDDGTGEFIKQWPNWTGVVPVMDDLVALHFGDDNEDERLYSVRLRVIYGTRPDIIKLYVRYCD
jgi:hypothetical protein